jgi:hypothetical protein
VAETKEEIAAERDALKEENERLKTQLAAVGTPAVGRAAAPQHTFQLSEGDRQELVARGAANVGGRLVTRDEVRDMLGENQQGVDLGNGPIDPSLQQLIDRRPQAPGVLGVTHVYPSVEPGRIDPAVAGTPGISGPPADDKRNR